MDQKTTILSITDNAAEKVKGLMEQEGEEDLALRIGVRPAAAPASSTRSTSTTRSTTTTR
jgi:Fe-S cluster assembly iron-binding protein IscA